MKSLLAVLLLLGLAVGCSGNSNKSEATVAGPAATPVESSIFNAELQDMLLAQQGKKWARLIVPDSDTVSFVIYPVDDDQSDPLRERAGLSVRCENGLMDMRFTTGPLKDPKVTLKVDNGPVMSQTWHAVGKRWSPSSADTKSTLKSLASGQTMKLGYHPSDKGDEVVTYNIANYRESVLIDPMCKK